MKSDTHQHVVTTALFLIVTSAAIAAEQQGSHSASTLEVRGRATAQAAAEEAEMTIGVTATATTADEASAAAGTLSNRLLTKLQAEFGKKLTLETSSYAVSPMYSPSEPGQKSPEIKGYTATMLVQAKVHELGILGKVIDTATQSGANRIHGLEFAAKNPDAVYLKALRAASADGRKRAEALAAALQLTLVRLRSAKETGGPPRPMSQTFQASRAGAIPVTPVDIAVTAEVVMEYEVSGNPR